MSGRPVRRRVLADVERAGGWPVVLARIASGERVTKIARSFGVSPSFFSHLLHETPDRHAQVIDARRRLRGHEPPSEVAELLGGLRLAAAATTGRPGEAPEVKTQEVVGST